MFCENMPPEFEMQKRPHLVVAAKDYVASPAAVAAIGTALGLKLLAPEMRRTGTAVSRAAIDLYIIDKV
jgi:hypothetical protein